MTEQKAAVERDCLIIALEPDVNEFFFINRSAAMGLVEHETIVSNGKPYRMSEVAYVRLPITPVQEQHINHSQEYRDELVRWVRQENGFRYISPETIRAIRAASPFKRRSMEEVFEIYESDTTVGNDQEFDERVQRQVNVLLGLN